LTIEGTHLIKGQISYTDEGETRFIRCKKEGAVHWSLYRVEGDEGLPTDFDACEDASSDFFLVLQEGRWHFIRSLSHPHFNKVVLPNAETVNGFEEYRELPIGSNNPSNCAHALRMGDKWIVVENANQVLQIDGQYLFDSPPTPDGDLFLVQTDSGPVGVYCGYGFEYRSSKSKTWKRS
jgi:hypothetical protein